MQFLENSSIQQKNFAVRFASQFMPHGYTVFLAMQFQLYAISSWITATHSALPSILHYIPTAMTFNLMSYIGIICTLCKKQSHFVTQIDSHFRLHIRCRQLQSELLPYLLSLTYCVATFSCFMLYICYHTYKFIFLRSWFITHKHCHKVTVCSIAIRLLVIAVQSISCTSVSCCFIYWSLKLKVMFIMLFCYNNIMPHSYYYTVTTCHIALQLHAAQWSVQSYCLSGSYPAIAVSCCRTSALQFPHSLLSQVQLLYTMHLLFVSLFTIVTISIIVYLL